MVSGDIIGVHALPQEHPPEWYEFAALMQHSWEEVRAENGGAPNVHGTADRMYDNLMATAACSLTPDIKLPDRETFIYNVQVAMLQPDIFRQVLFPGAVESVEHMGRNGPVVFWTAGDVYGGTDADGRNLPGSMEQYWRVLSSGLINNAQARAAQRGEQLYAFNISGSEDKFSLLPTCFAWLTDYGASEMVVLEDKLPNLIEVQRLAAEAGVRVHPIWLRQGRHGDIDQEAPIGVHSLPHIADLSILLDTLNVERPGFLVDYDGVVSNDEERQRLQQISVWNMLCREGWLQGSPFLPIVAQSPNGHVQ